MSETTDEQDGSTFPDPRARHYSEEIMRAARDHLKTRSVFRDSTAVDVTSDTEIRALFELHYTGGWAEFLCDFTCDRIQVPDDE